jgi:hypothetical protein
MMLHLANQVKMHSFCTSPIYMFGHLVLHNHSQAVKIDEKNRNKRWQEAEEWELTAILGYGVFNNTGLRRSRACLYGTVTKGGSTHAPYCTSSLYIF